MLEISDPDILENTVSSLVRTYGLKEEIIESLLEDCVRKLLLHPRASEFEDEIGVFIGKPLGDILRCPEHWKDRAKNPCPGDYLSYNYRRFGQALSRRGNWIRALEFFSKAVQKSENDKEKAKSLKELGTILFDLGRYKEAIHSLLESASLAKDFEELEKDRIALEELLAWIVMYRGNLIYAERIFRKHESYHFLGRVYYEMRRYEEALEMFNRDRIRNERLRLYRTDEDYNFCIGFNSRWKARSLVRLAENKKAEYFWEESKEKFQHHYAYAHVLLDKGFLALQSRKLTSAVEQFERAIDIWRPQGYLKGYLENTLYLGKAWLKLRDYKRAVKALKMVLDKSKPMGNNRFSNEAYSLMERIKATRGEKKFTKILREISFGEESRMFYL